MKFRVYMLEATHTALSGQPMHSVAKVRLIADKDEGSLMDLSLTPDQAEQFKNGQFFELVPVPAVV